MLYTGGVLAEIFDLEPHRMLFTCQKGHLGGDLKDFLLEQPQVVQVEWHNRKFYKKGVVPPRPEQVEALRPPNRFTEARDKARAIRKRNKAKRKKKLLKKKRAKRKKKAKEGTAPLEKK